MDDVEGAFTQLYRDEADRLYAYLCVRVSSPHLAEDLTGQVFLEAWRQRRPGRDRSRDRLGALAVWRGPEPRPAGASRPDPHRPHRPRQQSESRSVGNGGRNPAWTYEETRGTPPTGGRCSHRHPPTRRPRPRSHRTVRDRIPDTQPSRLRPGPTRVDRAISAHPRTSAPTKPDQRATRHDGGSNTMNEFDPADLLTKSAPRLSAAANARHLELLRAEMASPTIDAQQRPTGDHEPHERTTGTPSNTSARPAALGAPTDQVRTRRHQGDRVA